MLPWPGTEKSGLGRFIRDTMDLGARVRPAWRAAVDPATDASRQSILASALAPGDDSIER